MKQTYRGPFTLTEEDLEPPGVYTEEMFYSGPSTIYAPYIPLLVSRTIDLSKFPVERRDPMLGERTGARTFPVLVSEVLAALKAGRAEHKQLLKEAQAGYKKRVIEELERALKDAQAGTAFRTAIHLDIPRSFLKEYDNALELLAATQRAGTDKIELSADEYERFVRNIWSWTNAFRSTASAYVATVQGPDNNDGLESLGDEDDEG